MSVETRIAVLTQAIANLEAGAPLTLASVVSHVASMRSEAPLTDEEIARLIESAPLNAEHRRRLHRCLAQWDAAETSDAWVAGTPPNTAQRRTAIYVALGLSASSALREVFDRCLPFYLMRPPIQIGTSEFERWWTPARKGAGFYGSAYLEHLERGRGMASPLVAEIDRETDAILSLLADPQRPEVMKIRGLVLGHVQSGKTTNYAGLIAKASDAGYRLILVLTGMTNLLRNQTQRRLDLDLVGKEVVRSDGSDYSDDVEWQANAIAYGARPREIQASGAVNFVRLTRADTGYRALRSGISALEPQKVFPSLPLYDPSNLAHADIRLAVTKKNSTELRRLKEDLETLPRHLLAELPTILIDDECDLASINTHKPDEERTRINELLVELLKLLPRAQYVGYTATPAASILIDLTDKDDLFPRHFFVALEPRPGYMGAAGFHDLDWDSDSGIEKTAANSNEGRYVRPIETPRDGGKQPELEDAMDHFVLAGAIKVFREALDPSVHFRHHTMLVHESHSLREHRVLKKMLLRVWDQQAYRSPEAQLRLWKRLQSDVIPTTSVVGGELPQSREELRESLAKALDRIGADPVLVVNSDDDGEREGAAPDFSGGESLWRIICGGTKLSRGYTIEGLTVTYFRRVGRAADTVMQMGRWYGYRPGYQDLVRLFIGTKERWSARSKKLVNLYAVFEALAQDDRRLREDLRAYSWREGDPYPVTPEEVLLEVFQAHEDIRPTARNKMYRAAESGNWGGRMIQSTLLPTGETREAKSRRAHNVENWLPQLLMHFESDPITLHLQATFERPLADGRHVAEFGAFGSVVDHEAVLGLLEDFSLIAVSLNNAQLNFLRGAIGDHGIRSWALVLPQLATRTPELVGGKKLSVVSRFATLTGRIGVFTTSSHVAAAKLIARAEDSEPALPPTIRMSEDLKSLREEGRGALFVYLVRSTSERTEPAARQHQSRKPLQTAEGVQVGFALMCPPNRLAKPGRMWIPRASGFADDSAQEVADRG